MSYLKIVLLGNLGRDPRLVYESDGTARTDFTIAIDEGENTNWYHIWVRGKQAELAGEYLRKGSRVLVEGHRVTASYYTAGDGTIRTTVDINASRWVFAESKKEAQSNGTEEEVPF